LKKIIFISLVIAQLFGGGYYPSYGPGQLWNPSVSTSSGMVMFDEITIFGTPIVSGQEGGSTGACDSQNCDILAAMYNGICIGWTYMPIINETITLAVNFDDGVTPSVEGYPSYTPGVFEPIISFNFYDTSEGIVYFGVGNITPVASFFVDFGTLNINGDGGYCSSNGFQYDPPGATEYCGLDSVCNTLNGPDGIYENFNPLTGGSGDSSLCGYAGCMDSTAFNFDESAVIEDDSCEYLGCNDSTAVNFDENSNLDDGSCGYAGCNDPTAGNVVENGQNYIGQLYDCSGNAGIFDLSCCQYWGCNNSEATNYFSTGQNLDCENSPDGNNESCCTYAPTDIVINSAIIEETFNSVTYQTSEIQLSWNESINCDEGTDWSYDVCFENNDECIQTTETSIIYDIGWNTLENYTLTAYGCALNVDDEIIGSDYIGSVSTNERPTPTQSGDLVIVDSGEGFVELQWGESYEADFYEVTFLNQNRAVGDLIFIASNEEGDIPISIENNLVTAIFSPLTAGTSFQADITASNTNSLGEESSSSTSNSSSEIIVSSFPEAGVDGYMAVDTTAYPYSVNLSWESAPSYGLIEQEWTYHVIKNELDTLSTIDLSILISELQSNTAYQFQIIATSGFGQIDGVPFFVTTTVPGNGPDWGFQVSVNHLGFGYIPVNDENNFFGFSEEASNHYDNALDIVEPPTASAIDYVKFYFVREDWEEEEIGWGSHYTQEIRSRHDDLYALNNSTEEELAIFEGALISNMPGFVTLNFDLLNYLGNAPINSDDENFCPVYMKLSAFDEVNYYKINDNTEINIQINGLTEYRMQFIVGNIVPEEIPNFNGIAENTHIDPLNLRPNIDLTWGQSSNCEFIDNSEICNSFSSRYPTTGFILEFNDGTNELSFDNSTYSYNHSGNGNLSYGTSYGITLSGVNNSGKGISQTLDIQTITNLPPIANAGSQIDELCLENSAWNDYGCGNTYLTPHDGSPEPSLVNIDLHGMGYDPEGLGLRFFWNQISGDSTAQLSEVYSVQSLLDSAYHEPTFQSGLVLNSTPLEYEFELTVSDTFPFGLEQSNGYVLDKDTVLVTILPEPNLAPISSVNVNPLDNINNNFYDWVSNNEPGPRWEVPHDGNPLTNLANIQILNFSFDPDSLNGEPTDLLSSLWNRSIEAELFDDVNNSGQYEFGEPYIDGSNGTNPNGYYDWAVAIDIDTLTTRSPAGVDTLQLIVTDPYGFTDTSTMIISILPEPNEIPTVDPGNDTIVFLEPELSTYSYFCLNENFGCYPAINDDDSDELTINWHNGESELSPTFDLSEGENVLSICVEDPYLAQGCASKIITVLEEPLPDIIENYSSFEDLYYIELTWNASDLSQLSDSYSDLVDDEIIQNEIMKYPTSLNATEYEIYRDNILIHTIIVAENQTSFIYIDNGLTPSSSFDYKIIPINSHGRSGVESETKTLQTTDDPTVQILTPNGAEIWASSFEYDGNLEFNYVPTIKAFPIIWELTSVQNIGKINLFVSHDVGETWVQAEDFYQKVTEDICSVDSLNIEICDGFDISNYFSNSMSCEASGHNWNYAESTCHSEIINNHTFVPFISNLDSNIQEYTSDYFALSAPIFNGEESILDSTYIKGEGIEINHNTLVKIIVYNRGDYFDINDSVPLFEWNSAINIFEDESDEPFTISSNNVTRIFDIGWHLFGPPVQPYMPRMIDAFQEPHGFGEWGYEWIGFTQSGSFNNLYMQMGNAYYLNNTAQGNLTIYGDPITNFEFIDYDTLSVIQGEFSKADIVLSKGWNLISNTLVRPINKTNFEIIRLEDNATYSYDEAISFGFVQPTLHGFDESGYFSTNSIHPFEGYFWHAARGDLLLKVRPHSFEQLGKDSDDDMWKMNIKLSSTGEINVSDEILIGMSEFASDGFRYGEDEIDLPPHISDFPFNIYLEKEWIGDEDVNGNFATSKNYYSDIRKKINTNQSQIWKINLDKVNNINPMNLSWEFNELNSEFDISLILNGDVIDMRSNNKIDINSDIEVESFYIILGKDPLASEIGLPTKFHLSQAYPNPFNPTTKIDLALNENGQAIIYIYNLVGQVVDMIHDGYIDAGYHQFIWNANKFSSGIYLLKVEQNQNSTTQKLILIK
jgi:hypothetical protein